MTNGLPHVAPKVPSSDADFGAICASIGQRARCCTLGTVSTIFCSITATLCGLQLIDLMQLGQGLVCQAPPG